MRKRERATLSTSALGLAAVSVAAISLSSCDTMKSVGQTAAKPFKIAGQTAKKANPMRLLDKRKAKKDAAEDVTAELADLSPANPPATIDTPSLNTTTPGLQPAPGTSPGTGRSTLSLPSQPIYGSTEADLPTRSDAPLTTAQPKPDPASVTSLDEPLRLDQPPALPSAKPEPLSTPPTLAEDGFIQLAPKLPDEEEPLLPE